MATFLGDIMLDKPQDLLMLLGRGFRRRVNVMPPLREA